MVFRAPQVGKSTLVRRFCDARGIMLHEINLEKHLVPDSVFATLDIAAIVRELQVISGSFSSWVACRKSFRLR